MNDFQLIPVQSEQAYTADFTAQIPATVTLSAVVWTINPAITLENQSNDYANGKSTIKVSGSAHGVTYALKALATLSNGEVIRKDIVLPGWNG